MLLRRLLSIFAVAPLAATAAERPNLLWISVEDMSAQLGSYGDREARTPHLDALARESVRFTRVFASSPVCSPARSTLITGMFSTSLGTQRLRSQFPVPAEVGPFTAGLRALGYYCTNNVKTDYNLQDERAFIRKAWDESSATADWRGRPTGRPFFSVINLMTTHQSRTSVWPHAQFEREVAAQLTAAERHDPARLTLPPFYPDTAEARRAWARYRDCITAMDKQVGGILARLAADGLADDTIVFFFADHGMGMPRGKRTLYDSGLHVPLLVRIPAKWRHLAPAARPGTVNDELVSFVDFAPTVLALGGARPPAHQQGRIFLGANRAPPPEYVYGARDRVDEAFDLSRSVRDRRWLYIRNFMPHLSWMQPEAYSDASTFRRELRRLAATGAAQGGFAGYAAPRRATEELYDTEADPHQLRNLAALPEHRPTLERLRGELKRWQVETRDAGFLTEPQMWSRLAGLPSARSVALDDRRYPLVRLLEAAHAVGDDSAAGRQRQWLSDPDDGIRYWTAVGLRARSRLTEADRGALRTALQDSSPTVRIEAAAALAVAGESDLALPVLRAGLQDRSTVVALHAARALELLGDLARPLRSDLLKALATAGAQEKAGDDYAMFIRFALESALEAPAR